MFLCASGVYMFGRQFCGSAEPLSSPNWVKRAQLLVDVTVAVGDNARVSKALRFTFGAVFPNWALALPGELQECEFPQWLLPKAILGEKPRWIQRRGGQLCCPVGKRLQS
jgi:hypothetical protein